MSFSASMSPERRGSHPMYVTKWSSNHAGIGFQFNESKSTVTYAGKTHVVRASTCVPKSAFLCSQNVHHMYANIHELTNHHT